MQHQAIMMVLSGLETPVCNWHTSTKRLQELMRLHFACVSCQGPQLSNSLQLQCIYSLLGSFDAQDSSTRCGFTYGWLVTAHHL